MISKVEKILFYLLIFSLPFQTRKFVFNFVDVGKIGNEFASAFLYFTDILILSIFVIVFWRWVKNKERKGSFKKIQSTDLLLVSFFAVCGLSLIKANFLSLGFYKLIKLAEFVFLFFYIKSYFSKYDWRAFLKVIVFSGALQALIAILQYVRQRDLGLKFLGESPLRPELAGVAKFVVEQDKVIRAYGTFPHPNVLATFLLVSLFSLLVLHLKGIKKIPVFLLVTGYWLLVTGLFFTFSRIVIFFGALAFLAWFLFLYWKMFSLRGRLIRAGVCLFFISCFLFLVFLPQVKARLMLSPQDQAVTLRQQYNQAAYGLIVKNPVLGVGLGQFVPAIRRLPWPQWQLQPAHNSYLLIASEIGILGLGVLLLFLLLVLKKIFTKELDITKSAFFALFFALLLIMLFDHFPWTLQQGGLIFWMLLGFLAVNKGKNKSS